MYIVCNCIYFIYIFIISHSTELSEIQYHFTTCGKTGESGPSVMEDCKDLYVSQNSPITRENALFEFKNNEYFGAQGFRVPKAGLYNVTVAGAAGGKGICNIEFGRGLIVSAQLNVSENNRQMLVLVGQRGISPCDLDTYYEPCGYTSSMFNETAMCNATWYSLLEANGESDQYPFIGGGGGGGASMVRLINPETGLYDLIPPIIAAGGGGSPAVLSYNGISRAIEIWNEVTNSSFELNKNTTNLDAYREFLNAKSEYYDERLFSTDQGIRGPRIVQPVNGIHLSGGAGGGYLLDIPFQSPSNGQSLSDRFQFATGGLQCTSSILSVSYVGVYGGFGGGGGGCGSGGGGGGFSGGVVLSPEVTSPGGGGYSEYFNGSMQGDIPDNLLTGYNDRDGYVTIVPTKCGCAHECVLYEEEEEFRCECANGTEIAPDQSDCYQGKYIYKLLLLLTMSVCVPACPSGLGFHEE